MFNITIDGKAGCGKSTLADEISKKLGLKKFNTGAVYRGITCFYKSLYNDKNPNKLLIKKLLENLKVNVIFENGNQKVIVNNKDYTPFLRDEEISVFTPKVSSFDEVREKVRQIQREFAKKNDCVMEGRDIGTTVLPNATCKLFITAKNEVRAQRRLAQLKNTKNAPSFEELLKELEKRDFEDIHREHGALLPAKDSIIIDNSDETVEQSLERCLKTIQQKSRQAKLKK